MKTLLALIFLGIQGIAQASVCTAVIKDRSGYQLETFTRSAYSQVEACDLANYECHRSLDDAQSNGRYYGAFCEVLDDNRPPYPVPGPYPRPQPNPLVCQSDLVDYYGNVVRAFTAPGANEWEACNIADTFCKTELARNDSYGYRCVNRGLINGRDDRRPPRRTRTEECTVDRRDPAGMFIQSYRVSASGPFDSDVKGVACREASEQCQNDLRGRQSCTIAY